MPCQVWRTSRTGRGRERKRKVRFFVNFLPHVGGKKEKTHQKRKKKKDSPNLVVSGRPRPGGEGIKGGACTELEGREKRKRKTGRICTKSLLEKKRFPKKKCQVRSRGSVRRPRKKRKKPSLLRGRRPENEKKEGKGRKESRGKKEGAHRR